MMEPLPSGPKADARA